MTSHSLPLEQIRDLSANYADRQGLRAAPLALFLMAQSLPAPYVMLSAGILLALVSLAPLTGEALKDTARIYAFLSGFMLLLAGVRDHVAFVRHFPPMERQHD